MKVFLFESLLNENVQLARKNFVDSGMIDEEEFQEFLHYIDIKQKANFYFQFFFLLKEYDEDRFEQYAIALFKELNAYYKNKDRLLRLNFLESDNLDKGEFDHILYGPVYLIKTLEKRRNLLNEYNKLPSKYRRNLNKLINETYKYYPLTSQIDILRELIAWIKMYDDYPDSQVKGKILATAFSSKFSNIKDIRDFLAESYEDDLHYVPQESVKELLEFIEENSLDGDIEILYKDEAKEEIIIQVFSHSALRALTCNTKWCFSRSKSTKDWYEYANGESVVLVYNFKMYFPDSLLAILPNYDVYDANNSQLGEEGESYGKEVLSSYLSKKVINNLF